MAWDRVGVEEVTGGGMIGVGKGGWGWIKGWSAVQEGYIKLPASSLDHQTSFVIH